MTQRVFMENNMALSAPGWLTKHSGSLQRCPDASSWVVVFDGQPQYVLKPVPAAGKYSCQVMQSINGRRLDSGGIYPSAEEALTGGLEDLRKVLGW
jgi:hypothetical protein